MMAPIPASSQVPSSSAPQAARPNQPVLSAPAPVTTAPPVAASPQDQWATPTVAPRSAPAGDAARVANNPVAEPVNFTQLEANTVSMASLLGSLGFLLAGAPSRSYPAQIEMATAALQRREGLPVTGKADEATLRRARELQEKQKSELPAESGSPNASIAKNP